MSGNFWPIFVTVAALSSAVVWKYSPEVGRMLPESVRDAICSALRQAPAAVQVDEDVAGDEQQQETSAAQKPADAAATNTVSATAKATADKKAKAQPPAAATKKTDTVQAPKAPGPVTPTAQNPTGSPYLEPAAKALREFKKYSAAVEKRKGMDLATQRATMKKLHELNARVEFLNRKHREWKQSHPAAPGLGR